MYSNCSPEINLFIRSAFLSLFGQLHIVNKFSFGIESKLKWSWWYVLQHSVPRYDLGDYLTGSWLFNNNDSNFSFERMNFNAYNDKKSFRLIFHCYWSAHSHAHYSKWTNGIELVRLLLHRFLHLFLTPFSLDDIIISPVKAFQVWVKVIDRLVLV